MTRQTARGPAWLELQGEKPKRGEPDSRTWVVVEAKAKIIRQIFDWALEGNDTRHIANRLNEAQIPTLGKYKSAVNWKHANVAKVLNDDKVKGGGPRGFPGVISDRTFELAKAQLGGRTHTGSQKDGGTAFIKNLFSARVTCDCGSQCRFVNSETSLPYFACTRLGCGELKQPYEEVEEAILYWVLRVEGEGAQPHTSRMILERLAGLQMSQRSDSANAVALHQLHRVFLEADLLHSTDGTPGKAEFIALREQFRIALSTLITQIGFCSGEKRVEAPKDSLAAEMKWFAPQLQALRAYTGDEKKDKENREKADNLERGIRAEYDGDPSLRGGWLRTLVLYGPIAELSRATSGRKFSWDGDDGGLYVDYVVSGRAHQMFGQKRLL